MVGYIVGVGMFGLPYLTVRAGWLSFIILLAVLGSAQYLIHLVYANMIVINISEQERQIVRCLKKGVKWTKVLKLNQNKQKLTNAEIIKLAKICLNIEKHYKKPQDIEWGFKDGEFYVVRNRLITTL